MNQIIGGHKEYIVLERKSVEEMLRAAEELLEENEDERYRVIKEMCEWIKRNNIYSKDFKIKK